ncbi:MAG: hypothetical protein HY868_03025 [Chloroflexi bacterium]|nr:hypothetical protein [Chloroflexota bacterium]
MKTNLKISLAALPALLVTGAALFLLLAAVSNAAESKPGDLLYTLRSPALQLRLAITNDPVQRADIAKQLAPISDSAPKLEDAARLSNPGSVILNTSKDESRDKPASANVTPKVDDRGNDRDSIAPTDTKSKDDGARTEQVKDDDKNKTPVPSITDDKKGSGGTDDKDKRVDDRRDDDRSKDDRGGDDRSGDDRSGSGGSSSGGDDDDDKDDDKDED